MSRLGSRKSRRAVAGKRHARGRRSTLAQDVRRIGVLETLSLLLVCGAFVAIFAFAFSRPAQPDGSPAIERLATANGDVGRPEFLLRERLPWQARA